MAVKFVIDSAADVLPAEAQALGVAHLPLTVTFGTETFEDAVNLSHAEFYEKLVASKDLPTTSQVPPAVFGACFEKLTANGDEVVAITMSSRLSGTYQSAMIAADDFDGKVFVVDSLNATIGERILLMRGLELAQAGKSAAEIAAQLDEEKTRIRLIAIIDTLEYLKKGGRISAAVAFAGGMLAIKPAIEVKDGLVVTSGTARGVKKCNALLKESIEKYGGVNYDMPAAMVYASSREPLDQFVEACSELWQGNPAPVGCSLGCTIGTHIGPGAYGIAFFEK